MRSWKYSANPHSAFMSNDHYYGKWSKRSDMYNLFEPVKGRLICMVDRKELVNYCQGNNLNSYTYLLYLFERAIEHDEQVNHRYADINKCGNCHHLLFRDYRHNEGLCNLTRLHRCFSDKCVHEEEMS